MYTEQELRAYEESLANEEKNINVKAVELQKQKEELDRKQEQLNAQKAELQKVHKKNHFNRNIRWSLGPSSGRIEQSFHSFVNLSNMFSVFSSQAVEGIETFKAKSKTAEVKCE